MPVATVTPTPVRSPVTVPGTAELEFTTGGTKGRKLDVVVLYSVMDNAAVRITQGASHMRTIGPRSGVVRQTLGFGWTENPTPAAFRVKATVMEDGKAWGECTWSLQVQSGAAQQVMTAMETVKLDAPYTPLPDEEEMEALTAKAERRKARAKKAGAKKGGAKKTGAKKAATKKAATKKAATKKAATKKAGAKKAGARKTVAKKSAAKKGGVKKAAAKKGATRKTATRKTATKKAAAKRGAGAKRAGAKRAGAKKTATKKRSTRR
jgi:hypothetical protein